MTTTQPIDVELDLGNVGAFSVVTSRVTEGISRLTLAEIDIASNEDLDFSSLVRQDATLTLLVSGVEARRWTLKVGKIAFAGVTQGSLRYRVELHPLLWLLRHTIATRKFRNMSAKDIISQVLSEHQVPHEWRTTREIAERNYTVQYRETALDFVSRLLEFEGVYYTFNDDGVLVLGDRSPASPEVPGIKYFELIDSAGALARGELGIHDVYRHAEVASGAATVSDWSWKTPHTSLLKTKAADLDADLEIYDYPVGYREPAEGELLARLRLEALRAPAKSLGGRSNVPAFAPARAFTFGGLAAPGFEGEYLLVEIEHRARNPAFEDPALAAQEGAEDLYENTFRAIPRDVPFRPKVEVPRPTVQGCHTAMVRGPSGEEIHTDKFGRFKAQFHWDREAKGTDEDSRWVRQLQETSTSMALSRIGWEMHIAYIDGDPDRPVGIARNINGAMIPTYGLPAKKTMMTIKTQTYPGGGGFNELRLDDIAGAMRFDMKAERDMLGVVGRNRTETIGANEDHTVDASMTHGVERDQKRTVSGDEDTTVDGSVQLSVTGNREMSVGGSEKVKVDSAQNVLVDGDDTEEISGDLTTESGDGGSIIRTSEAHLKRTIKGSFTAKAKGAIEHQVGKEHKETVGEKITTVSEGGILQTCSGMMTVDVTGSVSRTSKEDMSLSAKDSFINISASAALESADKIDIRGEVIEIEAKSKVTLKAAGLLIEMTPGSMKMTGNVRMETDKVIRFSGNPENLTK